MPKVSERVAEFLVQHKIRHVFGIVGAGNAALFDAIASRGFTQIVCVHHEQAAVMAAGAYYRTNGVVTAAVVTTGAGSTNAVTGVVSTWMDSLPVLILSGNENSRFAKAPTPLRAWGVQGYDSAAMVQHVTKHAGRVLDPNSIDRELAQAYDIARSGRPGPVWLDIPMDVAASPVEESKLRPVAAATPAPQTNPTVSAAVERIARDIRAAKRPVVWLGHGIRLAGAVDLIDPLLRALDAPALVSWQGIDMLPSEHPRVFGRAGVYGQRAANLVLQNSDYVLAIGTRLAIPQIGYDLRELARAAQIAVVDIDGAEATKHGERVYLPVCADAKVFMEGLLHVAQGMEGMDHHAWLQRCTALVQKYPTVGPEHADRDGFMNSYKFMDRLSGLLADDAVVVTDMGTALLSGHQALKLKSGQRLITSTGLGEMGYGLPAAIGASFARNEGTVLCLNCDGGMMLNLQELQTMVHHRLPIKLVVFNNDGYLMIKHTQKALFNGRYAGTDTRSGVTCPDYTKLAKAFDLPACQVRTWEDFDAKMPQFLSSEGAAICEVFMHPEQLFVPKLSLAPQKDGSIVSPPLEDLSPLLPRAELREQMIVGMHPKSEAL